jgi:hypothetical protein
MLQSDSEESVVIASESRKHVPPHRRAGDSAFAVARNFAFAAAAACLVALGAVSPALARTVRVYEVDIRGEATGAVVQDAMRRAIVRATGRREAGTDPAFAALVTDAARYVQSTRKVASGATIVTFDGAAIDQAITAAGRSLWDPERPFTFVVFYPPISGQTLAAARAELDKAAEARGLPINLAPVSVVDSSGAELPRDQILQGAQRMGGDAVLIARSDGPPPMPNATGPAAGTAASAVWQWTLQTQFGSESWTGPIDAGINGAVDSLTRAQEATAGVAELEAIVQVSGVATLNDYAAVSRMLEGIPGQKRVSLAEASGTTATFSVLVRGGADTVDRALSNSARLARAGSANGQLLYTYRP